MQTTLDLYIDNLLSNFGKITATGIAWLTDGAAGHEAVTDLFNRLKGDIETLCQRVEPLNRHTQELVGVLITYNSIAHK